MAKVEKRQPYFFWLDLEMTGLDPTTDRILDAAVIVTDHQLKEIDTYETAVFQPTDVLANMNEWCQTHHAESGLLERVPDGISEFELDLVLAEIAAKYWDDVPVILCGNSIHQDRKFVDNWLPGFAKCLHYRMLDVSSFKIAFQEFFDKQFEKKNAHRALDDIRESLAEYKYYLDFIKVDA